ncbi:hypothetical protein PG990_004296 [Apiospora arundinis]
MPTSQENEDFLYVIHHVFLPPRLPQQDDFGTSSDQALTGAVLDAMEHFKQYVSPEDSAVFQSALDMVRCLSSTRPGDILDRCGVGKAIHDLADGGCLALKLSAQNLGLFIHRCDNAVRFEPFELLAENKQVTACTGRLQRTFPACCIELDHSQYQVPQFQTALADMLSELDAKTHSSCRPQSKKRGKNDEKRDTIIPRMIGPVVGFLRGLGNQAEALQLVKNSREEVLWANAKLPWHRSDTWLLLRVTLQLSFSRQRVKLSSCQLYKEFMLFLVSTLIDKATKLPIADELLFCMIAKFNRRLYKFSRMPENTSYPPGWMSYASNVVTNATARLEHKWEVVQDKDKPPLQLEALKDLDFKNDTLLKFTSLRNFVDITANPQANLDTSQALNAGFDYARFRRDDVPTIDSGRGETLVFVLANVEQWVCDELTQWLSHHVTESNTCHKLVKLLNGYLDMAKTQYEGNPHNLSIMWLCVMELWVACDQAAAKQEPLLVDYSIGFPGGFLEVLVLPRQSQMLRLRNVESYLREREARTKRGYPSAFEGFGLANSFAVRYYDNSCIHQQLHQEIVSLSQKKRSDKMQELKQKLAEYQALQASLDLGEFRAIGHIRSGARLQWQNILVQLYAPTVDFNNIETTLVVLQAIGEIGPCHDNPESHLRDSHAIVQDEDFACQLLGGLEATLLRFKENWECDIALFTLTSLCNRVMSLVNSEKVVLACCDFTRQVRSVARDWAGKLLLKRADPGVSEVERKYLHNRILAMALVSSSTFNADTQHTTLVLNDNQSVTEFLEASILIHDHHPTNTCTLSPVALVSLQAWRKLCYRYEATIHVYIALDRSCLDRAVLTFWENYKPGNAWESLQPLRRHVISSISSVSKEQRKLVVSLDILQGRLLVNGRPLSRLPAEYDRHPAYAQLFGSQVLEIAPSDEPGLEYTAVRKQNGWLVHFGMTSGELIIRACADDDAWEFVPPWHLRKDLPEGLIVPYSHWRNTRTGELELRDIKQPWSSQNVLWRTQVHPGGQTSLVNGDMSVIERTSCTAEKISRLFEPLEDASYITITLIRPIAILRIDLWRLNLSFTLPSQGCLVQSKKHPGMCIDSDQSFSALVGLKNKLVLRPQNDTLNKRRIVIIPHGTLDFGKDKSDHPATAIRFLTTTSHSARYTLPRPMVRRKYHCYEIDNVLGRLIDNGSLQSKLLICYLHAVTAHCLPDPLTGRTGTEEALRILKSAAILSFHRLQAEDVQLLANIAKLSPVRSLYPSHLKEMQQIGWSDKLESLSQHDEFAMTVETILREGQYAELFFPETAQSIDLPKESHPQLRQRALIRSACYHVDGFGAEKFRRSDDLVYRRRDVAELLSSKHLEERVCQITRNLLSGREVLVSKIASPEVLLRTLYDVFRGELLSHETSSLLPIGRFTIHWLDEPSTTIGKHWFAIQKYLTTVPIAESRYGLMAFFAALVYANEALFDVVQLLLAFVCSSSVRGLQHPEYHCFELHHGYVYQAKVIRQMIEDHKTDFNSTPESALPAHRCEKVHHLKDRRQRAWKSKVKPLVNRFEAFISKQPLTGEPVGPDGCEYSCYFRVPSIMQCIQQRFHSWRINRLLDSYLAEIIYDTAGLPRNLGSDPSLQMPATLPPMSKAGLERPFLTSNELFQQAAPSFSCKEAERFQDLCRQKIGQGASADDDTMGTSKSVDALVAALRSQAMRRYETDYVHELEASFSSYRTTCIAESNAKPVHDRQELEAKLREHVRACATQVDEMQRSIYSHLRGTFIAEFPGSAHCLPRLSPIFIVQQLNRHNWSSIPEAWKTCIEQYALAISHYQRAERLLGAIDNPIEFAKEVKNVGHAWKLREYPESLLLEVESGLIIRDVQEEVASSMRGCSENRVMQLNMGEGKSSVIVQIVAAYLANGNRLVRVIVAKPQSKQMRHMLVTKIGGLLDRRVFFLPFSRSFVMDSGKLQQIQDHFEACRQSGGILLVQPEQLLSFKLMGLEYVGSPAFLPNSTTLGVGRELIQCQKYLETHSRDIIDESDENFSVKFELIYTIGRQRPVEMSPDRWIVIQQVLEMIRRLAPGFAEKYPEGFELHSEGSFHFSRLRFLNDGPGSLLLKSVARHICDKGLHRFPIAHQNPETRQRVYEYITEPDLTGDQVGLVEEDKKGGFFCDATADILLLLRGLFSGGVLAFVFGQKRWRVNYDSPAPRSEFSHPDVVILLTQLSYYYRGLSDEEMLTAFQQLERLDQKSTVYGEWVDRSPQLPPSYRQFSAVNLKDWSQCTRQLFPALRYTKSVVDFYLEKVVFPHEMVEFPQKLSASGWDLAKPRAQAVTGFSGTCDSKYVLPTDIPHIDLPSQLHTNAKVLDYILRSENLVVELGSSIDGDLLLRSVVSAQPPIDVVLDVGALIIDMNNRQFAQRWLELSAGRLEKKQAVIFVNEDDEIMVIDRTGFAEPFLTSSFVDNTESCLVYLDEAHTRGIDLKLPDHYRACTTLGPKLTKDRLVQACMRMRKLGKGQSITFFIPREIQEKIRLSRTAGEDGRPITVLDVLLWSISETWSDTYKSIPLWATQGLRHQRQEAIWAGMTSIGGKDLCSGDIADYFEDEAISLKERYGPRSCNTSQALLASHSTRPQLAGRQKQLESIRTKCEHFGIETFGSATLQEEQERELAPEIEQERQVQHPQPLNPAKHRLHPDLRRLVSTGSPNLSGGAFVSAFTAFKTCSAASLGVYLVVLSPFEANLLLPSIKASPHVKLHVYAPRTNLSFPCLQDLKLYTTPALPTGWSAPYTVIRQLNLFSGQLYFQDLREYQELCAYLGLSCTGNDGSTAVAVDGFVGRCARYPLCQFTRSPNAFLQFIMANVRRDRQDISRTHIGRMLAGEILVKDDFSSSV